MGQVLVTLVLECNKILYPPFPLSDLPIEVVGLVIGQAEIREQLMFRKISKKVRELVDKQRPACTRLSIEYVYPGGVICGYDDYKVAYFSPRVSIEEFQAQHIGCHQYIQADNYDEVAWRDFQFTLKNPRLRLEKLEASHTVYYRHGLMERIPHLVFVRELDLRVHNPSCLLLILAYLRPRVLEKITIREGDGYEWSEYEMLHFALLEQWKQAEELELQYLFDRFPMEHARHFKRFKFEEERIDQDKFTRIKKYLSRLNFEQCIISYDSITFTPSLGQPVSSNETEDVFRQSIPSSNYCFEFTRPKDTNNRFIVKKKRRNR